MRSRTAAVFLCAAVAAAGLAAGGGSKPKPVVAHAIAVGDIAGCDVTGDEATAALVASLPGTILALGDLVYDFGRRDEWERCYDPAWGRFKARTRPSPGNHEYLTEAGSPYYEYFGGGAGPPGRGWYSFTLGAWHVVSLNSEAPRDAASPQVKWLTADLVHHRARCTLAFWHRPRFSVSVYPDDPSYDAFWRVLDRFGADLVLNGHIHDYQRFAPRRPDGTVDRAHGMREIVVGTGGRSHTAGVQPIPALEAVNLDTFGVLALTLRPTGYSWRFVPEAGKTFADSGSARCH